MNFISFRSQFKDFPFFSVKDIHKLKEKFYHHRLVEWQRKGLIERIANGFYKFSDVKYDEFTLFKLANKLYEPSYISLESALRFYDLIPESVYSITSVTSRKTTFFETHYGRFVYKKIKSNLIFGYTLLQKDSVIIKIAEPEKAILDFFYLQSELNNVENIMELRLIFPKLNETIDLNKLKSYLDIFNNKQLKKRINLLINLLKNA